MSKISFLACLLAVRVCIVMGIQTNRKASIIRQPFSYQMCIRLCKDFDQCRTPKFNSTSLRCTLENMTKMTKSCEEKLSTQNCSAGSRYSRTVLTRTKGRRSVKGSVRESVKKPVFRGCGTPPEVPKADVICGGGFVHAVACYACKSDFKPCGFQTESRCQANGEWTTLTGHCSRLAVPFRLPLPCQDQHVMHVKIKATPTRKRRMTFELKLHNDVSLYMDCRFHYGEFVRQLVLTTKINGEYGAEVKPSGFPFTVNELFVMEITLGNGNYQICVGEQTWSFKERIVGVTPKRVHVWGDINVELVEILV